MKTQSKLVGLAMYVVAMGYVAVPASAQRPSLPENTCLACATSDGVMFGEPAEDGWEDCGRFNYTFAYYFENTGYYDGPDQENYISIGCVYQY
jgi:hypothetical protein